MEKINVYIACCKKDYYLTRICVASIRYWNEKIGIYLIKDFSQGDFSTKEMEETFSVQVLPPTFKNLYGYSKLKPFFEVHHQGILLSDSDIVWLGNIESLLAGVSEDIVAHTYSPEKPEIEINKWYFNHTLLQTNYSTYKYPGFLFNAGFIVFDSSTINGKDFEGIIEWKDHPSPTIDGIFLCEDQGILNYIVAKKMAEKKISVKSLPLQIWGDSEIAQNYPIKKILQKSDSPQVVHWFGKKNGLISFQKANHILRFYERYYYSRLKNGAIKQFFERGKRTLQHFDAYVYGMAKKFLYLFTKPSNHE